MRLALLVLIDGPRLASTRARSEHTSELELAAVRGPIVDRNGEALALSAETRSIYARPTKLARNAVPRRARAARRERWRLRPRSLKRSSRKPAPFVWLARHLAPERARGGEELDSKALAR